MLKLHFIKMLFRVYQKQLYYNIELSYKSNRESPLVISSPPTTEGPIKYNIIPSAAHCLILGTIRNYTIFGNLRKKVLKIRFFTV